MKYSNTSSDTITLTRDMRSSEYASDKQLDTFALSPASFITDTIDYSLPGVDYQCGLSPSSANFYEAKTAVKISFSKNNVVFDAIKFYPWDTTRLNLYDCGTQTDYTDTLFLQ